MLQLYVWSSYYSGINLISQADYYSRQRTLGADMITASRIFAMMCLLLTGTVFLMVILGVIELIKKRKSRRSFTKQQISLKILEQIKSILDNYSVGIFGNKVTFSIVEKDFALENQKVKLGTYGL